MWTAMSHKDGRRHWRHWTLGREIRRWGRERKGAHEHNFQTQKVESRHAYGPLFCAATKGRTRSMRKQCQEADLD